MVKLRKVKTVRKIKQEKARWAGGPPQSTRRKQDEPDARHTAKTMQKDQTTIILYENFRAYGVQCIVNTKIEYSISTKLYLSVEFL